MLFQGKDKLNKPVSIELATTRLIIWKQFCINTQSPILNINLIHVKKN